MCWTTAHWPRRCGGVGLKKPRSFATQGNVGNGFSRLLDVQGNGTLAAAVPGSGHRALWRRSASALQPALPARLPARVGPLRRSLIR